MTRVNRLMMALTPHIFTSLISIMIILSNIMSSAFEYDVNSIASEITAFNAKDKIRINCPEECKCSTKPDESLIVARCHNLTDKAFSKSNIEVFKFQNNVHLETLNIDGYYQLKKYCNTSQNYLFDVPSLVEFSMSVSNYTCWSSSTFTKMPNVTQLKLERLNLRLVPGIFTPLRKLVKLEMRHITHIDIVENVFNGTDLHTLILAYSVVTSLSNIHIRGLIHLHLEYNLMENIGRDDFIGMPALEKLVIINSDIETIHEDAFLHLKQLKHLNLGGNKLISFTDNHLRNNYKLEVLVLAYNEKLNSLPVFKLNSTDTKNYSIYEFDCCSCGLQFIADGTFNAMPALTQLSLEKNRLETLPNGFFEPLLSLKSLDLSDNQISEIPQNMFKGAIHLTQLNLSKNLLTTLRMTSFLQTPELSGLDVSQCQIKIWNVTIAPVNSLRFLSLFGNHLEHITENQLKTVPYLSSLKALGNPIKCDDDLNKTLDWLKSHQVQTTVEISSILYCDSQFGNESCWDIYHDVLCNPNELLQQNNIDQENKNDFCIKNMLDQQCFEWNVYQWCYKNFVMLLINFISVVVIIIAISTIIKFWPRTQKREKRGIALTHGDLVYETLNSSMKQSRISK